MSDFLELMLGDKGRSRLVKFFILNPDAKVTAEELKTKLQIDKRSVVREIKTLLKLKFIKKRQQGGRSHFFLDRASEFYPDMKNIVSKCTVFPQLKALEKLPKIGHVKLILVTGVFANNLKSRADILVVGDGFRQKKFEEVMREIEAEIGKEIRHTVLSEDEYHYRINMFDKFTRDFFEGPHKIVHNQIGELPQKSHTD